MARVGYCAHGIPNNSPHGCIYCEAQKAEILKQANYNLQKLRSDILNLLRDPEFRNEVKELLKEEL